MVWKGFQCSKDAALVTVDQTASSGAATPVRRFVIGFRDVCALKDGKGSQVKEKTDRGRALR